MVVAATDIVFCGCANHAEDDTSTQGGAIDKAKRVVFSGLEMTGAGTVDLESDVNISGTWRVTGRDAGGSEVYEDYVFSTEQGPKNGTQSFERILHVKLHVTSPVGVLASNATLTVQEHSGGLAKCYLYGSGVSATDVEVTEVRRLFIGATRPAVVSPAVTTTRYEKFFIYNSHASDDASGCTVKETADPDSYFTFGVGTSLDVTESVTNRVSAPTSVGVFDNADKDVPNSKNLTHEAGVAVWVKMSLEDSDSAGVTSVNYQLLGSAF